MLCASRTIVTELSLRYQSREHGDFDAGTYNHKMTDVESSVQQRSENLEEVCSIVQTTSQPRTMKRMEGATPLAGNTNQDVLHVPCMSLPRCADHKTNAVRKISSITRLFIPHQLLQGTLSNTYCLHNTICFLKRRPILHDRT